LNENVGFAHQAVEHQVFRRVLESKAMLRLLRL